MAPLSELEVGLVPAPVAVLSVAASLETDSSVVALAVLVESADAVVTPAAEVALTTPDPTKLAACARPPKFEYVCK